VSSDGLELLRDAAHLVGQRRVIGALLGTVGRAAWRGRPGAGPVAPQPVPGPELTERVISPSTGLVRDYARFLGAAPEAYRNPPTVPAHLFPQWTFPLAARVLRDIPYDLTRILNAGCRLEMNASVPAASPLTVRARLVDVQDDGRRALLHQQIVTDTPSHPRALVADLYTVAPVGAPRKPLGSPPKKNGTSGRRARDAASVPADVREVSRFYFGPRTGLMFALLTGDLNPVHWVPAYARAAGFATPILHGFAMMARALDGLQRGLYAGAAERIVTIDVKFTRPLVLGHGIAVGLYLDRAEPGRFYLADAPGVRPYLTGRFEARVTERTEEERHA
jgi:acyl dehydratase